MKKILVLFVLILSVPLFLFSIDKAEFDGIVDFSITLDRLTGLLDRRGPQALPQDKIVVITGAISSLQIQNDGKEGEFLAELEVMDGEWVDMSRVKMYSSIVQLRGEAFQARIPVRRSRNPIANEISVNSEVMIVAKVVGTRTLYDGRVVPLLDALYLRTIG
jgi:hypothetical protein